MTRPAGTSLATKAQQDRPVIFFGPDWNRHPSTGQHLARCFLQNRQVVWVETVGLRHPALNVHDLRRSLQKLADYGTQRRQTSASTVHPRLHILTPTTLPFTRFPWVRAFNQRRVKRAVQHCLAANQLQDPALVVTAPSHAPYIGHMGEAVSLYLSMDDYALWYGMHAAHVNFMEAETLRRVDGIVAVSERLASRLTHAAKPVSILTQGVDAPHFALPPQRCNPSAFEAVFFGLLDPRLDLALLVKAARALPHIRFRLIGPEISTTESLRAEPNISIEPPVSYTELPQAIATADAFILPFLLNDLTRSCSPLKLKEYLATGRVVISVALPEAQALADVVHLAHSHDEFIRHLEAAAQGLRRVDPQRVADRLQSESWHAKANQLSLTLEQLWQSKQG